MATHALTFCLSSVLSPCHPAHTAHTVASTLPRRDSNHSSIYIMPLIPYPDNVDLEHQALVRQTPPCDPRLTLCRSCKARRKLASLVSRA